MNNKFIFVIIFLVVAGFFVGSTNVASDLHLAYRDAFLSQFSIPQIWQFSSVTGFGGNEALLMWNRPIVILTGFLGYIGISFPTVIKIVFFLGFLVLGTYSIFNFLKNTGIGKIGLIIASLLYLANTYVLLLIDGGQILIALAYAFFPLCYLLVLKGLSGRFKDKVLSALAIATLGFFDFRFIYLLILLLLFNFLYRLIFAKKKERISIVKGSILAAVVSGIIVGGINAYWVFPSLKSSSGVMPATYSRVSQTAFLNFTEFKHAASLLQPEWYKNVFGVIPPFRKEFLLTPFLAFLATILKRKDKIVWFWTAVAVISVFLTKGANPPFPGAYPWLFTHIPGFSLFRDSTKFFFLVALSYSVLIGFTVGEIVRRVPRVKIVFPLLLVIYFLFLARPVFLGKMTGTFSEPPNKNQYFSVAKILESDKGFGRILWIPSKAPLGFSSPGHPYVDALTISGKRPFATGTVGTFEFLNFLREAPYMGEIMKVAGIKHLAYPYPDARRADLKPEDEIYYHTFLSQLSSLPWVSKKISDIPIPILETKKAADHFFFAPNTYLIVGSDVLYPDLIKIKNFDLSKNALVWVEEMPETGKQIDKNTFDKIILYGKSNLDLAMSLVDKNNFIFPASGLNFSPDKTNWWKRETVDFVWMRDFLQTKYGIDENDFDYGGGYSIAEGNLKLNIKDKKLKSGETLLARVMKSSQGGKISFYQGNNLIGEIDTKLVNPQKSIIKLTGAGSVPDKFFTFDSSSFEWFNVGKLTSDSSITVETEGDINIINSLVVIKEGDLKKFEKGADELIKNGRAIVWNNLSSDQKSQLFDIESAPGVSYTAIAPTHYKVEVSGVKRPGTLVFSETYDPMWTSNGVGSFKTYSLLNGFRVDKDGSYDIYFTPEKYVVPGLVVSGLTLVLTVIACII